MAGLGAVFGLIGTGLNIAGSIAAANAQKAQMEAAARAEEKRGREQFAAYQRKAIEHQKKGEVAQSRAMALAASSGAGASGSPSVIETIGDIAEQAAANAEVEMTSGKLAKSGAENQAAIYRMKGKSDYQGSLLEGLGKGVGYLSKFYG